MIASASLRDGKTVGTARAAELDQSRVIAMMVGREVNQIFPKPTHVPGDVIFEARNIRAEDPSVPGKMLVDGVSFSVRKGEVVGIAGLMGAGRSELLMAMFGAHPGRQRSGRSQD
ncbi:MAG: ATP-binding cassette domain-containing protein [Pyrinomonadaceae bacterium]